MGGCPADSLIIGHYTGSVSVADYLTVENQHRNPPAIHLLYDGRKGFSLVRCGNYYVEPVICEITDVGNLFFIIVICRTDFNNRILMKHYLAVDFIIHFERQSSRLHCDTPMRHTFSSRQPASMNTQPDITAYRIRLRINRVI